MKKIFNHSNQKEKRRQLRQRSTYTERLLWQNLRNRVLDGFKFRRQYSVGHFILDFYCSELKLAIEVDGYSHESDSAKQYDARRQEIIETCGIRFLRIADDEVLENINKVLDKISTEIKKQTMQTG